MNGFLNKHSQVNINSPVSQVSDNFPSIEIIDKCIQRLMLCKACGPDDLAAEHVRYADPSLTMYIQGLFYMIFSHGFVPDDFRLGIVIPVLKDIDNYIANTLIPVISKLLGGCFAIILLRCICH